MESPVWAEDLVASRLSNGHADERNQGCISNEDFSAGTAGLIV